MRSLVTLIVISLCAGTAAEAQKRKKTTPSRSHTASRQPPAATPTKPRIIGSTVVIITKNGDRITGEVLYLTAYSVRLRADNFESSIAPDTIGSLAFCGPAMPISPVAQPVGPVGGDFAGG